MGSSGCRVPVSSAWKSRIAGPHAPALGVLCVGVLVFSVLPAAAAPVEWNTGGPVVSLAGPWKFRPGDDSARANPDHDDGDWRAVRIPTGFGRRDAIADFAWYRLEVQVVTGNASAPSARDDLRLGLVLGGVDSAYEVYAGGVLIGGIGALPPVPQMD